MNIRKWITVLITVIIITSIGTYVYFLILGKNPTNPNVNLDVENLKALSNGEVSFNVILNDQESVILETVVLNETRYLWSDGNQGDPTILKGETKEWSLDTGTLRNGTNVHVIVEARDALGNSSTIVEEPEPQDNSDYIYDYYGGVGLLDEGIHVIATSQDPRILLEDFSVVNDYWNMLLEHETTKATSQDFISIILSRGDKPTGGYTIDIENFAWLESYPVKFVFQVNFTDPGEGVMVTEALTNPLVLVPIGKLTQGIYNIEVPIVQYILNIDEEGNPVYTQILTFAPVFWEETLTIIDSEEPIPSTTFKVILNGNEAPDLVIQVDLSDGITEEEAKEIAETAFIQTKEDALHQLDSLIYNNKQITAHYIWGINEDDMGHIFDLTVDLTSLKISINHCR